MNPIISAISGDGLIQLLIWVIVAGLIYWLLDWAIGKIGLPEPFNKIVRVILVVVAAVILINALLTLVGHPIIRW